MATTTTPSWTENVTLKASGAIASGASDTKDIDLATELYDLIVVTVEIIFGASPDGDVVIERFDSTNSGTDDATEPEFSISVTESTSATKRINIPILNSAYSVIKVTNNDSADNVTVESWYAGRKWTSA